TTSDPPTGQRPPQSQSFFHLWNLWLVFAFLALGGLAAGRGCRGFDAAGVGDQAEVDLALLQAGLEHDDADAVAEAVLAAAALAGQRLADRVEAVVVVRQLGHVHQAVDLGLVQLHEQAEAGDAADGAVELAADVLPHPPRAVALVHFALGLVGPARTLRALQRQRRHFVRGIGVAVHALPGEAVLDRAVHQQVRIAADRRGEMRVGLQRQAEVADVLRR